MKVIRNLPMLAEALKSLIPIRKIAVNIDRYHAAGEYEKEAEQICIAERNWGNQICSRFNIKLHVEGLEHIPQGPVVFVSNHQSYCDIPAIAAASTVFFFKQYLEANFQISLVEAARIDGAGEFYTYNKIIMPIMVPAMATMGIMAVIASWNNYLTPLMLLSDPRMKTLPMMVKELRGDIYRTEYGSIYLGLTMTALPLVIVYFCFSKYIIAGVAVGGVKE